VQVVSQRSINIEYPQVPLIHSISFLIMSYNSTSGMECQVAMFTIVCLHSGAG
jgi:hypothetical protein